MYQEGSEEGKEGPKTQDDGIAGALVEDGLSLEEAALPHALPTTGQGIVLAEKI